MRNPDHLDDVQILARTLYGEARGETIAGRVAVANVIVNRFKAKKWFSGETIKDTCLKPKQFSCWNEGDPNRRKILSVEVRDYVFAECMTIAQLAVADVLKDCTFNSTHYHAKGVKPPWSKGKTPAVTLGNHLFFNDVD